MWTLERVSCTHHLSSEDDIQTSKQTDEVVVFVLPQNSRHRLSIVDTCDVHRTRMLRQVFSRHRAAVRSISGVYGSAYAGDENFAKIQSEIECFQTSEGRRPRILMIKMGQDGHDRGAKVIATAFADIGFDVDVGPLFQTPEEAARQAMENDVHIIGVSSQAAGHKTLVPQLIKILRETGGEDILVICGGVIPP